MECSKAKIIHSGHVKPRKEIGRKECQLVTFDLPYLAFYYNQKLIFYQGNDDFDATVAKLKDGLATVLVEFYQLAGRLGTDEEGVFRVEYDDTMDGVEVTEALAEEIGTDDLLAGEGTATFKDLIPYNGVINLEGTKRPLLAVQLTKLKDGIAIGCAFNHAILDGTSTWHFLSSWAEICGGADSISVPPFLERTKVRSTRVKLDLTLPPNPHATTNGDAAEKPASANGNAAPVAPQVREKVFKFSEKAVNAIKARANAGPSESLPDGKPFSTFQSLSAHIWRHVSAARELKPEDYTVYTVFADCRKRVDPPMPDSYFGNLIQAVFTVTAAGLLAGNPPAFGAATVRSAIEAHNAAAITARNEEWEAAPKIFQFKDAGVNCVAVGSSPRFKVYEVDFGFGAPAGVRSGGNNRFDGMVYLYQGKAGGGSIDVEISLAPSAMERLEKDDEFLSPESSA